MKIGFGLPVSGSWATPELLGEVAAEAERLGYDSLWAFQRLLSGATAVYASVLDPIVALSFAAARTSRVRLGVAVINAPFVSPVVLAKQVATLDVLSGGRVDLGLGTGWSPEEFTATGAAPERRAARIREYVAVLRALWSGSIAFEGEFYTVPPSRMAPLPVQRPGVPILLGGAVPAAIRRAGELGDGWVSRSATDLSDISSDVALVRQGAASAGRAAPRIVCRGVVKLTDLELESSGRPPLSGSYEQIREGAAWLGTQGVTEVFYDLNWDPLITAEPAAARDRALEILHNLAPVGLG
jgi:probable F420-dependent oxidoreductase